MSLFDSVMDVLGDKNAAGGNIEQLVGQLGNGGLEAIVEKLQGGGLGNVIQSWIGTGANLPISADQLHAVLGSEMVSKLAGSLGVQNTQLASVLPGLIDHLTPNGKLPEGGISDLVSSAITSGAVKNIIGSFFK